MKRCPRCGRNYGDADRFCETDGSPLAPGGTPSHAAPPPAGPGWATPSPPPQAYGGMPPGPPGKSAPPPYGPQYGSAPPGYGYAPPGPRPVNPATKWLVIAAAGAAVVVGGVLLWWFVFRETPCKRLCDKSKQCAVERAERLGGGPPSDAILDTAYDFCVKMCEQDSEENQDRALECVDQDCESFLECVVRQAGGPPGFRL